MARLPKTLWLVGHKDASDMVRYLGVFVSLCSARELFLQLSMTDTTAFLSAVKLQDFPTK